MTRPPLRQRIGRGLVKLAVAIGIVVLLVLAVTKIVRAHEWYPPNCCSGGDCGPITGDRISIEGHDYVIDHRWHVPINGATPSPDGRYHGCWPDKEKPPVCFYAPPSGS